MNTPKVFSGATYEENMHLLFEYNMDIDLLFGNHQFNGCLTFAIKQSPHICCG